ncbi:DEAD/DEAH box helicase family protein [Exiguobacterium sp. 17-1]|uniref:DEAD/DEAH box helicase family protein n=1 Tax=Exiguobacterium sp. 17-1 TaxID=2931981 RepID=UPI001FFF7DBE|nr:DEAD/DEAH box helicase family protein [Exiguobacterium sp. 17-1]MCK2156413.1 DEAD/DEAH box helicase family protein [Exiguobacterium sp. 17-1]
MLDSLNLKAVYDTTTDNISKDLIIPLLKNSVDYKRGVGFFTSSWLSINLNGILEFIENNGHATIITSPNLENIDVEALAYGERAKESATLYEVLFKEVENMSRKMNYESKILLAWLVADELLTFKIAIPKHTKGMFHDKYAIFTDEVGNKVVLHGSLNDSYNAFTNNGEGISVFQSWEKGLGDYISFHEKKFELLNSNQNDFFTVLDIPSGIKNAVIKFKENNVNRPYHLKQDLIDIPAIPSDLKLHDYQERAIKAWEENEKKGLLTMATGTGKTITALSATINQFERQNRIVNVISVPFQHLVKQWAADAKRFGYEPIECLSDNTKWKLQMRSAIDEYNYGDIKHLTLIVTHQSNSNLEGFLSLLSRIKRQNEILYIADEVHYLGSRTLRHSLRNSIEMRLGLSATPKRWRDEEGTKILNDYFDKEVFSFPIEKAISKGFLTPYKYIPKVVYLNEEEQQNYTNLSRQIAAALQSSSEYVEAIIRRRNQIIHTAENKQLQFFKDLEDQIENEQIENVSHTIVYCPEGNHRDILRKISRYHLFVQQIVGSTNVKKRLLYLDEFSKKEIQMLVAMKCLDEGVDIPATKRAYFLASTSNPRQFIQRRGRILRIFDGKKEAIIHDYLVFPINNMKLESNKLLVKKELARFMEFQFCSLNSEECLKYIRPFLKALDLEHLLYFNREEIYTLLGGDYDK